MIRILCVTAYYKPAYVYGGPARSVPSLCEALSRAGAQVTVYTTNANGPGKILDVQTGRPASTDGVQVYYYPLSTAVANMVPYYFYSPSLGKACASNMAQFDVVYIPGNWTYPALMGAKTAARLGIPYIVSPRGSFMDWSMSQGAFKKRLYLALFERRSINGASAIHITCSLEEYQQQKWNFEPPVVSIPNGIDLKLFESLPERGKLRSLLDIPRDATVSLFVGRLHKEKRLDLIIESFAQVAIGQESSYLLFVGSDQDGSGEAARAQVCQLGLSDIVRFAGQLTGTDLLRAYVDSDLLVLLSHRENFGMVVVEAMAAGLPVLLANEVGLANEVELARAGITTEAKLDEVRTVWQTLLSNSSLRKSMGEQGRNLVWERFDSDIVATKMLELFSSASGRG